MNFESSALVSQSVGIRLVPPCPAINRVLVIDKNSTLTTAQLVNTATRGDTDACTFLKALGLEQDF